MAKNITLPRQFNDLDLFLLVPELYSVHSAMIVLRNLYKSLAHFSALVEEAEGNVQFCKDDIETITRALRTSHDNMPKIWETQCCPRNDQINQIISGRIKMISAIALQQIYSLTKQHLPENTVEALRDLHNEYSHEGQTAKSTVAHIIHDIGHNQQIAPEILHFKISLHDDSGTVTITGDSILT